MSDYTVIGGTILLGLAFVAAGAWVLSRERTPPLQMTLRNLFISTFLWALWFGALLADPKNHLIYPVMLFQILGPFLAFGVLIGQHWLGAMFGVVALAALGVHIYIQIMYFGVPL